MTEKSQRPVALETMLCCTKSNTELTFLYSVLGLLAINICISWLFKL
jgi:hypothetical protein